MKLLLTILVACILFVLPGISAAHESQPGHLRIQQTAQNEYRISWRAPIYYGKPHPAQLELPEHWQLLAEPVKMRLRDSIVEKQNIAVPKDFDGSRIAFPGLEKTVTDVFVQIDRLDGSTFTTIATPAKPWSILRGERAWYLAASEYLVRGFQHILSGADHLLFVLGLLHGFGFASGLSVAGLPNTEIIQVLLWFNIGVEFGQLAFVAAIVVGVWGIKSLAFNPSQWVRRVPGYLVGCSGAFWTIDRVFTMMVY